MDKPKTETPKPRGGSRPGAGGKREGAGRKAVDPFNPRTVTVSAKVEPELKDWLERQPEGASEFIRSLILRAEIDSRML